MTDQGILRMQPAYIAESSTSCSLQLSLCETLADISSHCWQMQRIYLLKAPFHVLHISMIGPRHIVFGLLALLVSLAAVEPGYNPQSRGRGRATQGRGRDLAPARPAAVMDTIKPSTVNLVPMSFVARAMTSNAACAYVLKHFKDLNPQLFPDQAEEEEVDAINVGHSGWANYCNNPAICDATFQCNFHSGWRGCPRAVLQQFLQDRVFKMKCRAQRYPYLKGGSPGNSNTKVNCWTKDEVEQMELDRLAAQEKIRVNTARNERERIRLAGLSTGTLRGASEVDDRPAMNGDALDLVRKDIIEGVQVAGSLCVDIPGTSADIPSWTDQVFDLTPYLLLDPPKYVGPSKSGKP